MPMSLIDERAQELGVDPIEMVRKTLRETGSIFRASLALGLTPNSLRSWCNLRGLTFEIRTRRNVELVPLERAK